MDRIDEDKDKIKVEILLDPNDYALLEIAAKHYGKAMNTNRSVSNMAAIIVKSALGRIIGSIHKL